MKLEILPTRTGGAAENMAIDFLMLQRYANHTVPRFRHYDWRAAAFTFGYGQKISFVREQLPPDEHFELCRRPTGGGIVDHRDDWTYALVIPRGHAWEELRATLSYRAVHEVVAGVLQNLGVSAMIKPAAEAVEEETTGMCFQRAEIFDVVDRKTGSKIAGAAQKRNKHGLLLQGSLARSAVAVPGFDWEQFEEQFAANLGIALGDDPVSAPWPEFNEEELSGLTERYSSPEWIEYR